MRFLHLSDLHLGKRVNEFSMLEDQAYILKEILNIIDEQKVEAVLIAGDIYDKVIPSAEAVRLLDDFLTRIAARELLVFLISGNHDSAERIAFGARLMSSRQIYLSPVFEADVEPVTVRDEYGEINIYMLPFVKPSLVKRLYPEEEIITYQDAVNAAVQHMQIDTDKRNILLAHQFVTGAARCDSEELSVGGLDDVDASIFDGFDYVALGHIHLKDEGKIDKRGIWGYSGCLESCSFSYIGQDYGFVLLDIKDGKLTRTFVPFAKYFYRNVEIDVSKLTNFGDIFKIVGEKTSQFGKNDFVRVVFVGDRQEENEINVNVVAEKFSNDFFYLEVLDQTRLLFDLEKIANEKLSLKAEFLNQVLTDKTLGEEEKQQICNVGIEALKGEDISL